MTHRPVVRQSAEAHNTPPTNTPPAYHDLLDTHTPAEAAAVLHVRTGTLANWRAHGLGPRFSKMGTRVIYTGPDLAAYIKARMRTSTTSTTPTTAA